MTVAQRVAAAAKEGVFFGFGAERISVAEQSTLDGDVKVLSVRSS